MQKEPSFINEYTYGSADTNFLLQETSVNSKSPKERETANTPDTLLLYISPPNSFILFSSIGEAKNR